MDPELSRSVPGRGDSQPSRMRDIMSTIGNTLAFIAILYVFFIAIKLMGASSKSMGKAFASEFLGEGGSSALLGLMIGTFATSIVQSSSTVTSMIVGFVASGAFSIGQAIPMIMGANIGTTVTNTIVSLGHVGRKNEFRRAFAAGTVHDIFNILSVIVIFPIEMSTHFLERSAVWLSDVIVGQTVGEIPGLMVVIKPVVHWIQEMVPNEIMALILALFLLFGSMGLLVKLMRSLMEKRIAHLIDGVFFRNMGTSMLLGAVVTILVQSSSVTSSLIVPLVGSGILNLRAVFPYLLGANLGTTTTALLASLAFAATGGAADPTRAALGVTTAIVHTLFNVMGILIWYPMRVIPLNLASRLAEAASRSRRNIIIFVSGYFALYLIPIGLYLLFR